MKKSVVWAHRGACAYFPENTIPAFQGAVDMKADGVELDIHMSFDGKIVVSHDDSLARCGKANVTIEEVSYDEVKKHPVPGPFADKYPNVVCPLLSDVYELLRPHGMLINVEIKPGWGYEKLQKLVKLTHDMNMQDYVLYSCFDHTVLYSVRTIDACCRLGALYTYDIPNAPHFASVLGFTELHPHYLNCYREDYIQRAAEKGLNVNPWTVNDEKAIRDMVKLGCHGIITNYPDIARKVVDETK